MFCFIFLIVLLFRWIILMLYIQVNFNTFSVSSALCLIIFYLFYFSCFYFCIEVWSGSCYHIFFFHLLGSTCPLVSIYWCSSCSFSLPVKYVKGREDLKLLVETLVYSGQHTYTEGAQSSVSPWGLRDSWVCNFRANIFQPCLEIVHRHRRYLLVE